MTARYTPTRNSELSDWGVVTGTRPAIYSSSEFSGIVADGTTDDTTAFNSMITSVNAQGGGLIVCRGTGFAFAGTVVLKSNVWVDFNEVPITLGTSGMIKALGTGGTDRSLSGDVAAGATSIVLATGGSDFAAGSIGRIFDAEQTSSGNDIHQELFRVAAVTSNTLTSASCLHHAYNDVTYSGAVELIAPVKNAAVMRARIKFSADGSANIHPMWLRFCEGCYFQDCTVDGSTTGFTTLAMAFRIEQSIDCSVRNCSFVGSPTADKYASGQGYGLVFQGCSYCQAHHFDIVNARHSIVFQEGAVANTMTNLHSVDARISHIDLHGQNAKHNHVDTFHCTGGPLSTTDATRHCGIKIGNTSHDVGDHDNVIENGYIWYERYTESATAGGYGIEILPRSSGNIIRNVLVNGCDYGLRIVNHATQTTYLCADNQLHNVEFRACGTAMLSIDGGTSNIVEDLLLANCTSNGNAAHFDVSKGNRIVFDRCRILNPVAASGVYGIRADTVTGFRALDCDLNGANRGIKFLASASAIADNCRVTNLVESVIFDDGGTSNNYRVRRLVTDGTATPSISNYGTSSGGIVSIADGVVETTVTSAASLPLSIDGSSGSNAIPMDGTTPLSTEGVEICTTSYTPKNIGSIITVELVIPCVSTATATNVVGSIFRSTTCIGTNSERVPTTGATSGTSLRVVGEHTTTSLSAITISARCGPKDTAVLTIDSLLGTTSIPKMKIRESLAG